MVDVHDPLEPPDARVRAERRLDDVEHPRPVHLAMARVGRVGVDRPWDNLGSTLADVRLAPRLGRVPP